MINSIKHKALRNYVETGSARGLNAQWVKRIDRILRLLDASVSPEGMNAPGMHFHSLTGSRAGDYSVRLTGNYRVTFSWSAKGAENVNIEDYH